MFRQNMQSTFGIASYIVIAVVAVLLLSAVSVAVMMYGNTFVVDDEVAIQADLAALATQSGRSFSDVVIVQKNTTHARGSLTDTSDNTSKSFFAQKVRNEWEVISVTDRDPSCELFSARGFTDAFIQDCQQTYPDAVSIADARETFRAAQSSPSFLQIIAKVVSFQSSDEDGNGSVVTLNSVDGTDKEGDVLEVVVSQTTDGAQSVDVGDTIIISVVVEPNQVIPGSANTNTTNHQQQNTPIVTTTAVVNVTQAAEDIVPVNPVVPPIDEQVTTPTTNTNPQDSGGVYNLKTYVNKEGELENFFDIDNSDVQIKIEG